MSDAHKKYEKGDFEGALKALEKQKFRKQDKLLYLLDKATYLHAAGRYEESNKGFEKAYHLAQYLESKSAGQEIAAAFSNETILPYSGEKYERLLIQAYQMLNYALLGQYDKALIEVRQYHNDLYRFFGSQVPKEYIDPFALMLASALWEINSLKEDAQIDYRKAIKDNPKAESLKQEGNVIVVVESGLGPVLEGEKIWVEDIFLELPKLKERDPNVIHIEIAADDEKIPVKMIPFGSVNAMTKTNLEHKLEVAKDHKFVKTAFKQWAEMNSYWRLKHRSEGLLAAATISVLFNAFEAADTRIWSTLPESFQIARFELPPGEHKIKIVPKDSSEKNSGRPITQKIRVEKGRPLFLAYRIF